MIPKHVTHIRSDNRVSEVEHLADGSVHLVNTKHFTRKEGENTFPAINAAKRYVRIELGCKGGPKSAVRTSESIAEEVSRG